MLIMWPILKSVGWRIHLTRCDIIEMSQQSFRPYARALYTIGTPSSCYLLCISHVAVLGERHLLLLYSCTWMEWQWSQLALTVYSEKWLRCGSKMGRDQIRPRPLNGTLAMSGGIYPYHPYPNLHPCQTVYHSGNTVKMVQRDKLSGERKLWLAEQLVQIPPPSPLPSLPSLPSLLIMCCGSVWLIPATCARGASLHCHSPPRELEAWLPWLCFVGDAAQVGGVAKRGLVLGAP